MSLDPPITDRPSAVPSDSAPAQPAPRIEDSAASTTSPPNSVQPRKRDPVADQRRKQLASQAAKSYWAKVRQDYLKKCDEIHRQEHLEAQKQAELAATPTRRSARNRTTNKEAGRTCRRGHGFSAHPAKRCAFSSRGSLTYRHLRVILFPGKRVA